MAGCLALLEHDQEPEKVARIFEIKLLSVSGIGPEIDSCAYCGCKIATEARFSNRAGGLICKSCFGHDFQALNILMGTVATIDYIERSSLQQFVNLKIAKAVESELKIILRRFLDYHLEKRPKSLIFLEKVKIA